MTPWDDVVYLDILLNKLNYTLKAHKANKQNLTQLEQSKQIT